MKSIHKNLGNNNRKTKRENSNQLFLKKRKTEKRKRKNIFQFPLPEIIKNTTHKNIFYLLLHSREEWKLKM